MNPIYIDYYPHEKEDCYKINLPFTDYHKETTVLCKVSEGFELAQTLALGVLIRHITKEISNDLK